ncbi:MAG: class IV adenylate cyclase [Candidatus Hodarchaeales archaeon]
MEIEIKIPIDELFSETNIVKHLTELIGAPEDEIEQIDWYFTSPVKDFHESDEALRIRRIVSKVNEEKNELTYKGAKTGSVMKIREEITVTLTNPRGMTNILKRLGFNPSFEVRKNRINWNYRSATISIDNVKDLGKFIEIELNSDESVFTNQTGKKEIETTLNRLFPNWSGIEERKSYLELLLEMRDHPEKR